MSGKTKRLGFTPLELVVVVGIVGVMMGMLLPAVMEARSAASRIQCESNLRQIGMGLHHYAESNDHHMPTQLRPSLLAELGDYSANTIWKCPNDTDRSKLNSYAEYYIPRHNFDTLEGWQVLVRCPRHPNTLGWLHTLRDGSATFENPNLSSIEEGVVHDTVPPGTELSDGSVIEGSNLMVIMCRREGGGLANWHVVVGLPQTPGGKTATGTFQVKKGSKFEVLTPAGLAAVEGTRFTVTSTLTASGHFQTDVNVSSGIVRVMPWESVDDGTRFYAGGTATVWRASNDAWGGDGAVNVTSVLGP